MKADVVEAAENQPSGGGRSIPEEKRTISRLASISLEHRNRNCWFTQASVFRCPGLVPAGGSSWSCSCPNNSSGFLWVTHEENM